VALPAFTAAAERRRAATDRYLLPAGRTRRSAANPHRRRANNGTDGRTDRQTDGRTLDRYSDPAPHAMRAVPKIAENATQNVLHRWDKKTARCWDGCINQYGGFSRNPEVVFGTSCSLQYVSTCQLLFFLIRSTSNKTVFFLNKCQSYLFK